MSTPFLLVHDEIFQPQLDAFLERHGPQRFSAVITACKKAISDPFNAGGLLQGLPRPLAGNVYKLWIQGRTGYRFIYLTYRPQEIVLGVYLSDDPRADFDYHAAPWADYAQAIWRDLTEGNTDKFSRMMLP